MIAAAVLLACTERNAGAHDFDARPALAVAPSHTLGVWAMAMIWRQTREPADGEMLVWFVVAKSRDMRVDCPRLAPLRWMAMIA